MKTLTQYFSGKTILITAGPTYEELDPVRFIGNYSSGKMGFAIANAFVLCGAKVILISGPSSIEVAHPLITRINVISADQMFKACKDYYDECHIGVLAAAVADYKPLIRAKQKIKKAGKNLVLELTKTVDIARELGKVKKQNQLLIGFALETEDEENNALLKLISKNLDFIVLNSLQDAGAGFRHDTNNVTIFSNDGMLKKTGLLTKREIAFEILRTICEQKYILSMVANA